MSEPSKSPRNRNPFTIARQVLANKRLQLTMGDTTADGMATFTIPDVDEKTGQAVVSLLTFAHFIRTYQKIRANDASASSDAAAIPRDTDRYNDKKHYNAAKREYTFKLSEIGDIASLEMNLTTLEDTLKSAGHDATVSGEPPHDGQYKVFVFGAPPGFEGVRAKFAELMADMCLHLEKVVGTPCGRDPIVNPNYTAQGQPVSAAFIPAETHQTIINGLSGPTAQR
jgi:hypothetical protein